MDATPRDLEDMNAPSHPILLALRADEVIVVLDALVAFATIQEAGGDPTRVVATADGVAERVRTLTPLVTADAKETVKAIGLGRYAQRPQG